MTLLSRRFKLEYTDSNENVQTIAEYGQSTGALSIDHWTHIRKVNDPDILKIWLEGDNFGNSIPSRKTEFGTASNGTDEPEIRYKQYDPDTDSFITRNRFYPKNKGTIDEQGRLAWKLYSFMKYTARQSVSFSPVSTNVEDALNNTLPTGYVADVPAGATPPSVNAYSLNARREKGFQELTRNYKYAMTFTSNLDGSNNAQVKYEPEGFGGTVDTLVSNEQAGSYRITDVDTTNEVFVVNGDVTNLFAVGQATLVDGSTGNDGTYTISALNYDSNNNETDITVNEDITSSTADGRIIPGGQAVFKSWEKDKTESIINKVTVEGTNSNGNKITGTATNQAQIDNFGEKFLKVKVGYIEDSTEAQNIAEKYLVPGKDDQGNDITTVPESGTLKTTVYSDNIVNDSVQVVDNTRNIDDTYTVVQQRNYWPEGASELELEFEKENLEKAAREAENLRDERARLYPNQQTDVGNQPIQTTDGAGNIVSYTNTASADTSTTESKVEPDVSGTSGFDGAEGQYDFVNAGATVTDGSSTNTSLTASDTLTNFTQLVLVTVNAAVNGGTSGSITISIDNTTSGTTFFSESFDINYAPISRTVTIIQREDVQGETIQATVTNNTGSSAEINIDLTVDQIGAHQHNAGGPTTGYSAANHDHGVSVSDSGHGSTGDKSTHSLEGNTEPGQNINVSEEDKTDR